MGPSIILGESCQLVSANNFLDVLLKTIEWKNDEAVIFGKRIITKRKVAWYGDMDFEYTYSNTNKRACPGLRIFWN